MSVAADPSIDARNADPVIVRIAEASLPFIELQPARAGEAPARIDAPGRVSFRDAGVARVGAPVTGRILEVHVRVGETVEAGQPLFTMGSPDAAAMRAELASARARLSAARKEVERQRALQEAGVGLARDLVEAEADLAALETEMQRAKTASALIGRGRGGKVVVSAPISGTVLGRTATAGTVAEPGGSPLIEIGDPADLWVTADVYEDDLDLVAPGASAEIHVPGRTDPVLAEVVGIAGPVDTRLRRAPVFLAPRPSTAGSMPLRAGTHVRTTILASQAGGSIVLPTSAVLIKDGTTHVVYVARDEPGTFERRTVTVGRPYRGRIPILEGVRPGERVVVDNALLLDGAADLLL